MVKQQNSANPQMLPQRPQVQQLSPEHQQYVEWDQSKLQQAQKESMEPTTSQVRVRKDMIIRFWYSKSIKKTSNNPSERTFG